MWMLIASLLLAPRVLLAEQIQIGGTPPDAAKERAQAVERAKSLLREAMKLPGGQDMVLESAKATTWPDTSLGCPEKGHMYAQVVTPGWTVVIEVEGHTHEVHVSRKRAVVCPAKNPPQR